MGAERVMTRPPLPAPPYAAACLCGAARYRLDARPKAINACHCLDCKKLSGATHIHMIIAERGAFSHNDAPLTRFRKRADSGREIDIVRCAACGTRLWHEPQSNPELVFIAAGTLDNTSWIVPTSHIWTRQASPGVSLHADALHCDAQPETRQLLFDHFTRLYGSV